MRPDAHLSFYELLGHWDLRKMIAEDSRIDGSSTITATEGILRTKSVSLSDRAFVYETFFIPNGGWVECTFAARAISGTGKFSYNSYPTNIIDGSNEKDYIDITDKDWKYYRFAVPATAGDNYVRFLFGQWKDVIGETEFKDIKFRGFNINPKPDFRCGTIRGRANSWEIYDSEKTSNAQSGYFNYGLFEVSRQYPFQILDVRMIPFRSWYRPNIQATVMGDNSSADQITASVHPAINTSDPDTWFRIKLYKAGKELNLDSLSDPIEIQIIAIG